MKHVIIDDSINEIKSNQYAGDSGIESVFISKTIKKIGSSAFYNCNNLKKVVFEEGSQLKSLDDSVFQNCAKLESICLPKTLEYIRAHCFWGCENLPANFSFPETLAEIESTAFFNTSLRNISLPLNCKYQEKCHGFPYAPSFPESTIVKGGIPFDFYEKFSFPLPKINNDIDTDEYSDCDYVVKQGTKEIINNQFSGRVDLEFIVIPASVKKIGTSAFYGCVNLHTVIYEAGSKVKCIDFFTFQNCINLRNIILPYELEQIRAHSFWGCFNLKKINLHPHIKAIDATAFFMTRVTEAILPVQCDFQKEQHAFPYEPSFPNTCNISGGNGVNFYADRNYYLLQVAMRDTATIPNKIVNYSGVTDIVISDEVKVIGNNYFAGATKIEKVIIPASVYMIGAGAFYGCSNLQEVTFHKKSNIKIIANYVFQNCSKLSRVYLSEEVVQIGSHSFWGCPNLKNIEIPNKVCLIDASAFFTTNLSNVRLPSNCKYQAIRQGFPHEKSFPEECVVVGGLPVNLYENMSLF